MMNLKRLKQVKFNYVYAQGQLIWDDFFFFFAYQPGSEGFLYVGTCGRIVPLGTDYISWTNGK